MNFRKLCAEKKAKTNEANGIDKIPNEIMKNNISTQLLGPGPYAAYIYAVYCTCMFVCCQV